MIYFQINESRNCANIFEINSNFLSDCKSAIIVKAVVEMRSFSGGGANSDAEKHNVIF
jgi:hypothetical protein